MIWLRLNVVIVKTRRFVHFVMEQEMTAAKIPTQAPLMSIHLAEVNVWCAMERVNVHIVRA